MRSLLTALVLASGTPLLVPAVSTAQQPRPIELGVDAGLAFNITDDVNGL